ncbi:hypothetical protein Vadar_002808 [Vaccinium darrowii]|uniref:Uncharacterized protein n=1 Tax=Vaccinium darrowii TaxID=229202 RepID=A0ACB7XWA2_9ERIC|nr:hypothetical protein Vadar_002808 [Vaccinium darrowii]
MISPCWEEKLILLSHGQGLHNMPETRGLCLSEEPVSTIPTNAAGLIEYKAHPFWAQKYCPSHEHDGTPRCCSCERFEPRDSQYAALDDGCKLCLVCLGAAILDTNECQPLYVHIQVFYEGLNMKVEQQVPLLLVERQALNVAMDGERGGREANTAFSRPGHLTCPRPEGSACQHYTKATKNWGRKQRLLIGSILAHEMMHAWLRIKGYRTLSQDVEEGICQVLADMWLESQTLSISGSNAASTSFSLLMEESTSPLERKLGDFL